MWERPDDLIGRQDVDKMISTPPDAVSATKPARQSDTSESSDDDQPTPAKKMKHEDIKQDMPMMKKVAKKEVASHEKRMHKMKGGGYVRAADGCATKGKTKGTMVKMCGGGKMRKGGKVC